MKALVNMLHLQSVNNFTVSLTISYLIFEYSLRDDPSPKLFWLKASNMVENIYLYVLSSSWYVSISALSF